MNTLIDCPHCKGTGTVPEKACKQCGKPSGIAIYCSSGCWFSANPPSQELLDLLPPDDED